MSLLNQVLQDLDDRAPVGGEPRLRLAASNEIRVPVDTGTVRNHPDWWRLGIWSLVAVAVLLSTWFITAGERHASRILPTVSPKLSNPPPQPPLAAVASRPAPQQPDLAADRSFTSGPPVPVGPAGRLSDEAPTEDVLPEPPRAVVASTPVPQQPEAAEDVPVAVASPDPAGSAGGVSHEDRSDDVLPEPARAAVAPAPVPQQPEVAEDSPAAVAPPVPATPAGGLSDEAPTDDVLPEPSRAEVAPAPALQQSEAAEDGLVAAVPPVPAEPQGESSGGTPGDDLSPMPAAASSNAAAIAPVPLSRENAAPDRVSAPPPATPDPRYLPLRNTEMPPPTPSRPKRATKDRTPTAGSGIKPTKPSALHPLAESRDAIAEGELSLAEYLLQMRLRSVPRDLEARELLVGLMLRGKRYSAAMQQLERGLDLDPGHNTFVLIKARLLVMNGDAEAAARVLEARPRQAAGKVERLQMLGALYQQQARFEDAVRVYRALLSLAPADGAVWVGLAISLDGLADPAAFDAYARALTLGGLPAAAEAYARERLQQRGFTGG